MPRTSYTQTTPTSSPMKQPRVEGSPLSDTYKSRSNTGAVSVLMGEHLDKDYSAKADPCLKPRVDVALFPEFDFVSSRYMFQKIADKAEGNTPTPEFAATLVPTASCF